MKFIYTIVLSCMFIASAGAQVDFDNFQTLRSKGTIPRDFSERTSEKIQNRLNEHHEEIESETIRREFLEKTEYAIEDLLHSGLVVYGDDVSNYVSSIADKLLEGNPELRSKLRFYTLKLNTTNAFSTDQGIIFVTSGLISQLSSEAQLAFVLAHEISHYTEKHVVETFTWKKNNRYGRDWVERMSVYSKDKEFSADNLAVDMYREAGYSKSELESTFDVLLYSYLPFDEVEIELDYFATDQLFLPSFLFPKSTYEIKADPDEDDSGSSHPNISKRKNALSERISAISDPWGSIVNNFGDERFYEVRNIARFETVRTDVMEANYGDALYSIYLLEQEFPNSVYLHRMKMLTWLGLYQFDSNGKINKTIMATKDLEGESAAVHYFVRKLNGKALKTLALRNIYDINKKYSTNSEINAIYDYALNLLANDEKFDLDSYSSITFSQYSDSLLTMQAIKDSTGTVKNDSTSASSPPKRSKYDRITRSSAPAIVHGTIDSLKFYLHGLSDLVTDSSFRREFESHISVNTNMPPPNEVKGRKRRKQFRQEAYNELKIGSNSLIVVEPRVVKYDANGVNPVKSEKLENLFSEAIVESGDMAGTMVFKVDKRDLSTPRYSERSVLFGFINQLVQDDKIQPFPVDYQELQAISEKYGTSDVMFTIADHSFRPQFNYVAILSILAWPTLPAMFTVYLPLKLMLGNRLNVSILILDLETCQYKAGSTFQLHETLSKHNLGARMYSFFKHISSN